ncbi:MAG TPA: AtpZ/AtpI family protein [Acidimicrobiales bacterium]|nr:AtpZ/AtpI family protein [Acidimicrobiales bacterium]
MDRIPIPRTLTRGFGEGFTYAFEFAITIGLFLGLGWVIDGWLGTEPVFMIVFSVLGLVGQSLRLYYTYEAKMKALDDERHGARTP